MLMRAPVDQSPKNGDGFYFDELVSISQDRYTNEGAGNIVITECACHHFPSGRKVFATIACDIYRGLHNVEKCCSSSLKSGPQIANGLFCLTGNVVDSDGASVLIEGARTGREDKL
jgi:hypothetical protein